MNGKFGSVLLDTAVQLVSPFILLFALYVVFHGHYSPGGGFQGGAMIAAVLIVLRLVQGPQVTFTLSRASSDLLGIAGVSLFAGVGLLSVLSGGNFLDYGALPLPADTVDLHYYGILAVELGVTIGVAGVLMSIYLTLSGAEQDAGPQGDR
jgi:multicomponent Na+:H+ antiporter subunit B